VALVQAPQQRRFQSHSTFIHTHGKLFNSTTSEKTDKSKRYSIRFLLWLFE
jgi:hypothetical protein